MWQIPGNVQGCDDTHNFMGALRSRTSSGSGCAACQVGMGVLLAVLVPLTCMCLHMPAVNCQAAMQEVCNRNADAARNVLRLGLSAEQPPDLVRQVQPQAIAGTCASAHFASLMGLAPALACHVTACMQVPGLGLG